MGKPETHAYGRGVYDAAILDAPFFMLFPEAQNLRQRPLSLSFAEDQDLRQSPSPLSTPNRDVSSTFHTYLDDNADVTVAGKDLHVGGHYKSFKPFLTRVTAVLKEETIGKYLQQSNVRSYFWFNNSITNRSE